MMLHSMHFGRAFWLDDDNEFCSCPWRKDGTVEDLNWDYVSEWDMEGVNFDKLFDIHRTLTIEKHNEALEDYRKNCKLHGVESEDSSKDYVVRGYQS